MSDATATELAPARPRAPSRAIRKRDGRVRRVVRKIKKRAAWLDQPHFASLLYAYGALFVRFVDLNAVKAEPIDAGPAQRDHGPIDPRRWPPRATRGPT